MSIHDDLPRDGDTDPESLDTIPSGADTAGGGWLSPAAAQDLDAIDAALDRLAARDRGLMDGREAAVIARRLAAATSRAGCADRVPAAGGGGRRAVGDRRGPVVPVVGRRRAPPRR